MSIVCSIYRSPKKEGMYLYVDKKVGLDPVPDSLMRVFGEPEHAMTLLLSPERKLARVDRDEVVAGIENQGFFLQMPPGKEEYMLKLYNPDMTKHRE